MVFSSAPVYLDHPNWHQIQQSNDQDGGGGIITQNSQLQPPPPLPEGGGNGGSTRPSSMVDRARLANLQPELGLKCPRCDSTNTKFCYFNNYNLTQPRHFCKTCRRYWTRGGALRNVPVGGGCRRNKRSNKKSSSSKPNSSSVSPSTKEVSDQFPPRPPPQSSFIAALQNLTQYGAGRTDLGFPMGNDSSGGSSNNLSAIGAGGSDYWRFPFLSGLEPPTNLYSFTSHGGVEPPCTVVGDSQPVQLQLRSMAPSSGISGQPGQMKMEENQLGLNLPRQFFGVSENNHQLMWGGNFLE